MSGLSTRNVVNNAPIVTGTVNEITVTYTGTTAQVALASNVVNPNQTLFSPTSALQKPVRSGDGTVYKIPYDITTVNQGGAYNTSNKYIHSASYWKLSFLLHAPS